MDARCSRPRNMEELRPSSVATDIPEASYDIMGPSRTMRAQQLQIPLSNRLEKKTNSANTNQYQFTSKLQISETSL
ncbi:hypothetical protein M8J77_022881 [Diaphorina citri]|nr:hypothetical protein M8J77_022881 [Diaphorina citri]